MSALPFAFRINQSKYAFAGEAQLINAYAEPQGPDAKDPLAVLPSYGMTLERAVTDTPQRGAIYLDDLDCIYTVHATSVYKVRQSRAVRLDTCTDVARRAPIPRRQFLRLAGRVGIDICRRSGDESAELLRKSHWRCIHDFAPSRGDRSDDP